MLQKYVAKFVMDIFPSVIATIIGAYIVNHYIVTKPAAEAPVAAAASTVDPNKADPKGSDTKAAKAEVKGSETPSDLATAPDPAAARKSTADKSSAEKSQEKSVDKPTETASLPVEPRRHQPAAHDKTVAKSAPAAAETSAPAVAAVSTAPPAEASPPQEERRDANDLARAAIERLRNSSEASRASQVPRVQEPSRVVSAPVPPLPPAIVVATPGDGYSPGTTGSVRPPYAPVARVDDPLRPTPPADIPTVSGPMNIHAEAMATMPEHNREHNTVAEDVLSAAKSVFHAVMPH